MNFSFGSLKRHLIVSGTWVLAGKMTAILAVLMTNAFLARILSPTEMGAYFIIASIVTAASSIARLGMGQVATRLVAESWDVGDHRRTKSIIKTVMMFGVLGGMLVVIPMGTWPGKWLYLKVLGSEIIASCTMLTGLWVLVLTMQNLIGETFRGLHDIRSATIFGGIPNYGGIVSIMLSALSVICVSFLLEKASLRLVLLIFVTVGAVTAAIGLFWLYRKVNKVKSNESIRALEILEVAWPLLIVQLTNFVLIQSDVWILGASLGEEKVAVYAAASRLVVLITMPLQIVNSVISPMVASLHVQGQKARLESLLRRTATVSGLPALLGLCAFMILGGPILELVYGEYYGAGWAVLVILSIGRLFNAWSGSCGILLTMSGHQRAAMVISLVCSAISVVSAISLVKAFGPVGVAASYSLGIVLQNLVMTLYGVKFVGVKTYISFPSKFALSGREGLRG